MPTRFQVQVVMFHLRINESIFYSTSPYQRSSDLDMAFLYLLPPGLYSILYTILYLMIYCLFLCPVHWQLTGTLQINVRLVTLCKLQSHFTDSLCSFCVHSWRLLVCLFLSCLRVPPRSHPILNDRDVKLRPQNKSSKVNKQLQTQASIREESHL